MTVHESLDHPWLTEDHSDLTHRIPASRYKNIRERIRAKYVSGTFELIKKSLKCSLQADWPHPMPAIGRIANFSSLKKLRAKEHHIQDSYFGEHPSLVYRT